MSDDKYEIGYGKPPRSGQFKKGRSGNPRGRPKGTRNLATDLQEELSRRVATREGDKISKMSRQQAMLAKLVVNALNGDVRSAGLIFRMIEKTGIGQEEEYIDDSVTPDDEALIEAFLKRQQKDEG